MKIRKNLASTDPALIAFAVIEAATSDDVAHEPTADDIAAAKRGEGPKRLRPLRVKARPRAKTGTGVRTKKRVGTAKTKRKASRRRDR